MTAAKPATAVKLRPRWCLYPRGLCALCLHRFNPNWEVR